MLTYDLTDVLQKKIKKLLKKNPELAKIFYRKVREVTAHDIQTIETYKNLRFPLHKYKRIHLTRRAVLLFRVDKQKRAVRFTNIVHRDDAYR